MSLFTTARLIVSLPAAEISGLGLPGSVMTAAQAQALPVSHGLACAMSLIESHCQARGIHVTYVARPEIFTHGASLAWLRERLGDATEHVCLSDGSTVKHVAGCRTHLFLYRMTHNDSYESFHRLCRRAPGLLSDVQTQINTRLAWGEPPWRQRPLPVYLHARQPPARPPALAYPFQFRPHLAEETALRIARAVPAPLEQLKQATQTLYIVMTEAGLADAAFVRHVAHMIRTAFVQKHARLLLRLPEPQPGETISAPLAATLKALGKSKVTLPRNAAPNIFFLAGDVSHESAPENLFITLTENFDFWRHPPEFYASASAIHVAARRSFAADPEFLPLDVTAIYGPRATRTWLALPPSQMARTEA